MDYIYLILYYKFPYLQNGFKIKFTRTGKDRGFYTFLFALVDNLHMGCGQVLNDTRHNMAALIPVEDGGKLDKNIFSSEVSGAAD